jgi:hypothetical protein
MDVAREALGKRMARWTDQGGLLGTAMAAVSLARRDAPTQPTSSMYEPSLCVIAQGAKRVRLGDDTSGLDVHHCLITSVDLPTVVQILHASREQPYLGLLLNLDRRAMAQLMVDSHLPPPRAQHSCRGMAIGAVTWPLVTACQRVLDLLAAPQDIPILAPLIQREMLYRLLVGDQGARLRQIASAGSQSHQIAQAIEWLKRHYTLPLRSGTSTLTDLAFRLVPNVNHAQILVANSWEGMPTSLSDLR